MTKPLLHFAHANGFPAKVYSHLFRLLGYQFEVIHVDRLAHDPRFPVENGWRRQGDEIIEFLETVADRPVLGVGHSFGASSTFMAAAARPDLFNGIIMLDPVAMNGFKGYVAAVLKKLRMTDMMTPARHSANRRRHWPDLASAERYFKSKALFRDFHEQCLQDFLNHALEKTSDGYELFFKVEQEMAVYRNAPTHFDVLEGRLKSIPGIIINADKTNVAFDATVRRIARQQNFELKTIDGFHMFPLEQPGLTAQLIKQFYCI